MASEWKNRTTADVDLFSAVETEDFAAVKDALQRGANPNLCEEDDRTCLFPAITNSNAVIARYLVENGADLNAKNTDGSIVFHSAIALRSFEMTMLFLQMGAFPGLKDAKGKTAFDLAEEAETKNILTLLKAVITGQNSLQKAYDKICEKWMDTLIEPGLKSLEVDCFPGFTGTGEPSFTDATLKKFVKKHKQHLRSLSELSLSHHPFLQDISPLAELPNLKKLYVDHSRVKNVAPLAELVGLQVLSLIDNGIADVTPLSTLVGLKSLALSGNEIQNLTPITDLRRLDHLVFCSNPAAAKYTSEFKSNADIIKFFGEIAPKTLPEKPQKTNTNWVAKTAKNREKIQTFFSTVETFAKQHNLGAFDLINSKLDSPKFFLGEHEAYEREAFNGTMKAYIDAIRSCYFADVDKDIKNPKKLTHQDIQVLERNIEKLNKTKKELSHQTGCGELLKTTLDDVTSAKTEKWLGNKYTVRSYGSALRT